MKAGETGRYSCSAEGMRFSFHERGETARYTWRRIS